MEAPVVSAVEHEHLEAKVTIRSIPNRPGMAAMVFRALAAAHVNVDIIVQTAPKDCVADISFTISKGSLATAAEIAACVSRRIGGRDVVHSDDIAKVSVIGSGMRTSPEVAAKMFGVLADVGINIHMISTSTVCISCVVSGTDADRAVKCLRTAFDIDPPEAPPFRPLS